jgi:hypothetical protein
MVDKDNHQPPVESKATHDKLPRILLGKLDQDKVAEIINSPEYLEWAGSDLGTADVLTQDDGTPQVYYHGGSSNIDEFNRDTPRHTGHQQVGIYFSPDVKIARYYADQLVSNLIEEGAVLDASVYAVFLKSAAPLIIQPGDAFTGASINEVPKGYDSVINPQSQEVVVFDPAQIFIVKSTKLDLSHIPQPV